jgi:hypothetical protein
MGDLSIKTHSNTFATLLHITHRGYYNDTVKEEKKWKERWGVGG